MLTAINAWSFPAEFSIEQQLAAAASAGFAGIELTIAADGPLSFDSPLEACAEHAHRARNLNLHIVGLASGDFWHTNYAAPEESTRQRAVDLTLRMLDRAVALAAETILVVPAVVGKATEPQPRISYADALQRSFDALCRLRPEVESRGVNIALENVWNRFLLSPFEAADLLDRVNSPHIGWYFDTGNVMPYGYPQDWILTLGGRIKAVHVKDYDLRCTGSAGFCPLGEGSVDWPQVIGALRQVGYDGPLTYEGGGEPVEIRRRLDAIINGRPIAQREESA